MANNYEITMKEYNGTDYDNLYPETTSGQVKLDAEAQNATNLASGTDMNDALQKITSDGVYKVGDTLITARTNLGDKWLLQNGQTVNSVNYPELNDVFGSSYLNWTDLGISKNTTKAPHYISASFATNGSTTNPYHILWYTEHQGRDGAFYGTLLGGTSFDNISSWTQLVHESSSVSAGVRYVSSVKYLNGYWTYSLPYAAYYSQGEIPGTFSTINIGGSYNTSIVDCEYFNGNYYCLKDASSVIQPYNCGVLKYTNLSDSTYTSFQTLDATNSVSMYKANDYLVIVHQKTNYQYNVSFMSAAETIVENTYPGLDWTGSSTQPDSIIIPSVVYFNGYYYGCGGSTIYRTTNPATGTWTSFYTMPGGVTSGRATIVGNNIFLTSGYYITASGEVKEMGNKPNMTGNFVVAGEKCYCATQGDYNSMWYSYPLGAVGTDLYQSITLPSFSPATGLYAYIRAKT